MYTWASVSKGFSGNHLIEWPHILNDWLYLTACAFVCVCDHWQHKVDTLTKEDRTNEKKAQHKWDEAPLLWISKYFRFLALFFVLSPKLLFWSPCVCVYVCQLEQCSTLYAWFHFVLYIFSGTKWKFYTIFSFFSFFCNETTYFPESVI